MKRISPYPEFCGRVRYSFLRPNAGVRNDDREAINLAIHIFIWDRCKFLPLGQRTRGELEIIKGLHRAIFEMETDSIIGEDFRINGASTKA